jgi:hypothetical protein
LSRLAGFTVFVFFAQLNQSGRELHEPVLYQPVDAGLGKQAL